MGKTAWDILRNPDCRECKLYETAQSVCLIGQGPFPCDVMIVGEAPGYREDDIGKPFSGKAGQLLDEMLEEAGINRDKVFITNAVHCRPPDNRTPSRREIKACSRYLKAEVDLVKPKYVLVLGSVAMQATLGKSGVTQARGQSFEKDGRIYFVTIHPAALFRQPQLIPYVKADISRFAKLIRGRLNSEELKWVLVNSSSKLKLCLRSLEKADVVSYDLETEGLNPRDPDKGIYCIGLAQEGKQWVIPFSYPGSPFSNPNIQDKIIRALSRVLKGKKLVAHNGKFDNKWLRAKFNWAPGQTFDTMLAAYLLDENAPHGLKPLAKMYFDSPDYEIPQPVDPEEVSLEKLAKYCAYDVFYTLKLYHLFRKELLKDASLARVFKHLLMPASRYFEVSELEGIYIDPVGYQEAVKINSARIKELKDELDKEVPHPVNWNSTQQVAKLLFDELGLEIIETTPGGQPSTSSELVLPRLKDKHPIVEKLMKYREQVKLGQFLKNWGEHMDENSRIYPTFKLHGTVTGRLSCADPNLQQVPRDTFLRSLITAPPGWVLVEADYSQIELRIAAMEADDLAMKQAFQTGQDIHRKTASGVMGIPPEKVTKEDRKKAKAVNFGFVYGMGAQKFQEYARTKYEVELTLDEAGEFRERFFEMYSGLPSWHERQRRLVRKYKYVRSRLGRKRRLPGIDSPDKFIRGEAERQAINSPVQSLASDLNLFSFVRIHREQSWDKIRPLGTIHDAILFAVKEDCLEEMVNVIRDTMTDMATVERVFKTKITVPVEVEIKAGPWGKGQVIQ